MVLLVVVLLGGGEFGWFCVVGCSSCCWGWFEVEELEGVVVEVGVGIGIGCGFWREAVKGQRCSGWNRGSHAWLKTLHLAVSTRMVWIIWVSPESVVAIRREMFCLICR